MVSNDVTVINASLLREIESDIRVAFKDVTLGRGVSIRQSEVIDRRDEKMTDEEFDALPQSEFTQHWEDIPDSDLDRAKTGHFDAEAYRYYIPAFVLRSLRGEDPYSFNLSQALSMLTIPIQDEQPENSEYHLNQFSLLNFAQKRALAKFLSSLPQLFMLNDWNREQVDTAIAKYWHSFLTLPENNK